MEQYVLFPDILLSFSNYLNVLFSFLSSPHIHLHSLMVNYINSIYFLYFIQTSTLLVIFFLSLVVMAAIILLLFLDVWLVHGQSSRSQLP